MLKFFEVEESSQKVILLITSQEFNKVPSRRGPFLSRSDPLSYEDLEIPAVCVSLVAPRLTRGAVPSRTEPRPGFTSPIDNGCDASR